ncbi:hypothetical protein D9M69_400750 [compost metagenome]
MAGDDAMAPKQGLVVVRAVLAATIRVQQHLFSRLSACHGHLQHGVYQGLLLAQATKLGALNAQLAIARKGIATLLFVLALPSAQQAFSDAQCLGHMGSGVPASTRSTASRLKDLVIRRLVWVMNTPCGGRYPP